MMKDAAAALVVLAAMGTNSNAAPSSQAPPPAPVAQPMVAWQEPATSTTWTPPSAPYQWQFDSQERTLVSFSKQALFNGKKIAIGTKLPVLAMTCSVDATSVPTRKSCSAHADPEFVLAQLAPTMRVAQSCFDYNFIPPSTADVRMAEADPLNYTKSQPKARAPWRFEDLLRHRPATMRRFA